MEEKIKELEKRLTKLERIEKRRKGLLIAKIVGIILLVVAIIIGGYIIYLKVEETLRPYKEFIEKKDEVSNSVKDSINDNIEESMKEIILFF